METIPVCGKDPVPFMVMAKPTGPRCNLACTYCYYSEKEILYHKTRKFRMSDEVLDAFVRGYIVSQHRAGAREIVFSWQGGEPTLAGLAFFRRVVTLEEKYRPAGTLIRNALQTNGTLLDSDWASFFRRHDFLVGLSLDGPRALHDPYRLDRRRRPTFDRAMAALALLRAHGVEVNVLVAVHSGNVRRPREVYRFLKRNGVTFMQFIPVVERISGGRLAGPPHPEAAAAKIPVAPWSVSPRAYGDFLCAVFDEWVRADVGRVFVQFFDVQLALWMGMPAALCWFAETCGQGLAVEHNGDVYACDHYVYPEYRLGNILETSLGELAASPAQVRFGCAKATALPRFCHACAYRFACNGGCPKHRFLAAPDGEPGLNYLCAAYRKFFAHTGPFLQAMAALVRRGEPAHRITEVMSGPACGRRATL